MGATIALSLFLYFFGFYIFRLFTSDPAVLEIGLQMCIRDRHDGDGGARGALYK